METGDIILILSFAVPVAVILLILYFLRRGFKKQKKYADELKQKISKAKPATAEIISASQGMTGGDINRIIHLKLRIIDGFSEPYAAETTWFVNTLHFDKIKEGNVIRVRIDSENRSIIYPEESWGKYTEGYENL
ncbi:MAG: hypothetical protein JSS91_00655 [Bacteroidetes bacterium]|nr:hypothetical protein [Bacteroidota bacterium]